MAEYAVLEIFDAPQGEGAKMGQMATFIRFAGCNLTCPWCDTDLSERGTIMSPAEIVAQVKQSLVIFTGGEPAIWDLRPLVKLLSDSYFLAIETNGTRPLPAGLDWVACSPKREADYRVGCQCSEIKIVVDDGFEESILDRFNPSNYNYAWLQPEWNTMAKSVQRILEIIERRPGWRLGIQAHKFWEVR
jgi:7-carboxy-7-deazaguanine synthase